MNKLFTKIAAILSATMAVGVGVAAVSANSKEVSPAQAETATYQHIFEKKPSTGTITLSNVSWSLTASNLNSYNNGYKGVQVGASGKKADFQLTSSSSWGSSGTYSGKTVVTEIRLWLNAGANGNINTLEASVGGVACTRSGNYITKNSSASAWNDGTTQITFTIGSTNTGVVSIHFGHNQNRAIYVCGLEIDCETPTQQKTLSSISITTPPTKTTYYVWESFSSTGMVVKATYSDNSEANVTSSCTFTPDPFTTTGNQNVTVSYTEGGVNKTATQAVTVNPRTPTSVSSSGETTSFDAGAKFSYGGTLTASYNYGSSATVTPTSYKIGASGITPTSAGDAITTDTTLTVADHNGKTVYVLYTENGTTVWTSYTITVNALPDVVLSASNNPYPSSATSKGNATEGPSQVTLSGIEYQSSYGYVYNSAQLSLHPEHNSYLGNNTAFSKNIKKIVIAFNDTNSAGRGTMYEGDSALAETSSISASMSSDNKTATYTFSDANPYFKFKQTTTGSSNYINILSISIYLGSAIAQNTTTALSVSPNSWSGYDSEELDVSDFSVSCTTSATSGEGYVFQGIGYMSGETFVARDASFSSGNPTTSDTRLCWKGKYPTTAGGSTYLYAYVTLSVTHDAVSSIEITGSMSNTTYDQGDPWDPTGFTVNAYYLSAPSTPVDVTGEEGLTWTYSPATTASTSTTKVTCTATFEGQSDTSDEQTVTINEKSYLGGIVNGGRYVVVCANSNAELPSNVTISSEYKSVDSYSSGDENSLENCWTFTTTGVDNVWTITNYKGETLKALANNDSIRTSTSGTNSAEWTASLVGSNITIGGKNYVGLYFQAGSDSGNRYLTYYSGNTSFRGYTSTTSQGADSAKFALIPYELPDVLDSALTLTGKPASLTAGSTFPGVTKAEAEYSVSGTVDVTSDVTYTLGGSAISVGDTIPVAKVGSSVEVVVTYTDANSNSATASFNVPVVHKAATSVTLDKASATIAKGGTVQLTATVSDQYAIQTVKWTTSNSSIATLSAATSTSGSHITVTGSSSNAGSATITAYVDENDNGSLDSGEKSATCTVTVSGDPVLNMYDEFSELVTGETLNKFTGDSNFYLNVVAQNFVGEITYTWSSSNTSAVSIHEEADEMCEFTIAGSGNATISCHAVGATSGNLTVSTTIHVAVPAVTSVTWDASNISAYTNQSLTSAIVNGWTVSYEKDNGDSGTVSFGNYDLYLGNEKITSLPRAWTTADDGKTLHVEYGGVSTSEISVQITEHLNSISYSSWSKVTDESSLQAGDTIVIAEDTKGSVMGSAALKAGETLTSVSATITDGEITDLPSDGAVLTVGGSSGAWTLQNSSGEYLSITSASTRHLQFVESEVTLTISITDGEATIGKDSTRVLLNANQTPFRYSTYQSATSATMLLPEIYKSSSGNIADTNVTAQRALLSFVASFNSTMNCDDGGSTENIASKWSTASAAFTTALNGLSSGDQTMFKRLVANATAVDGGDSLQDFLARYDYIIAKYKLENDFLHTAADRAAVSYSSVTPLSLLTNSSGTEVAIIVVTSMIGLSAIGGYFFLRKRKEI